MAAYDVADNKLRERVARVLLEYGRRVQRSVFEVWLEPDEVTELRRRVGPLLARRDAFDLFPVDERGSRKRWRWQRPVRACEPVIVLW